MHQPASRLPSSAAIPAEPATHPVVPGRKPLWIWFAWLGLFYSTWLTVVLVGDHFSIMKEHWPIALAMTVGSYVAGSTPMGGGTVGFPILVLLFDQPADLGRDFSFAIQSIGMTSASILILCRRQMLATHVLLGALLATLIGTPIGLLWVAPHISSLGTKLVFAVLWASFGLLHLFKVKEFCAYHGNTSGCRGRDFRTGFITGLLASLTVSAISGVGIDMLVYAVLVLLFRCDLKIAIPTSVIVMAVTSVAGIGFKMATGTVNPGVFENWLAAAPIVALGAPLGVFVVSLIGREITLYAVSVLCLGQFFWTCQNEWQSLGWSGFTWAVCAVVVFAGVLYGLYLWGRYLLRHHLLPKEAED